VQRVTACHDEGTQSPGVSGRKDGTTPNATRVGSSVSAIQKRSRASELWVTAAVHGLGPRPPLDAEFHQVPSVPFHDVEDRKLIFGDRRTQHDVLSQYVLRRLRGDHSNERSLT
jgi:hypothetical protein